MFFAVSFCAEARQDLAPKAAGDFFHTVLAQNHEKKTTQKATPERYSKGNVPNSALLGGASVPQNTDTVISRLETYAICPALTFSSFSTYCTMDSLRENWTLFLYGGVAIAFSVGLAYLLIHFFPIKNDYTKCCYKYALTFSNFGYIGNAVVPMLLGGDEHLYMYLLFTVCLSFVVYLWGFPILTPKESRPKIPLCRFLLYP